MRLSTILLIYAAILIAGYMVGRRKAATIGFAPGARTMHSLPAYHGYNVMLWGAIPALVALIAYFAFGDAFIVSTVVNSLPEALRSLPESQLHLIVNDIRNVAAGNAMGGQPDEIISAAADQLNSLRNLLSIGLGVAVLALAVSSG